MTCKRMLPLDTLQAWMDGHDITETMLRRAGLNMRTSRGQVTDRMADRIACHYGLHPTAIYGDTWYGNELEAVT